MMVIGHISLKNCGLDFSIGETWNLPVSGTSALSDAYKALSISEKWANQWGLYWFLPKNQTVNSVHLNLEKKRK